MTLGRMVIGTDEQTQTIPPISLLWQGATEDNEQILRLNTERGELILLVGNNGNGKSSLLESFEYTLYGKVKSGKTKKWHKLSTLPNRVNGELLNRIKFIAGGTEVEVKRGISPGKLELWENGVLNERAGKSNIDKNIEKYVGMDIETFKSFISMSINDFKNFISLTNEEKKLLLDEMIASYSSFFEPLALMKRRGVPTGPSLTDCSLHR